MGDLRKTPLHDVHRESGAKMVPFGGWDMPVEYSGLIAEHNAVRTAAGLFDVSHMGQFEVEGEGALAFLQNSCLYSALASQKQRRQNGHSFVGFFGSSEHQTAPTASNSPRQFQHVMG